MRAEILGSLMHDVLRVFYGLRETTRVIMSVTHARHEENILGVVGTPAQRLDEMLDRPLRLPIESEGIAQKSLCSSEVRVELERSLKFVNGRAGLSARGGELTQREVRPRVGIVELGGAGRSCRGLGRVCRNRTPP